MKAIIKCMLAACALMQVACSEEDEITVDVRNTTYLFAPQPDDHSEEAELRRQFFATTGSYLLFNDTLQHYVSGVTHWGDTTYFTEKLDLWYSIGAPNSNNTSYTYLLIPTIEKKKEAVAFLEDNILSHMGRDLCPFSWLLVNRINYKYISSTTTPYTAMGERAIAVAMETLARIRNEAQKKQFVNQILGSIMVKIISDNEKKFTAFFKPLEDFYSTTFTYDGSDADNTRILNEMGFITKGKNSWGTVSNGYFPTRADDLADFARLVIGNTIEQIESRYSKYPAIIERALLLRSEVEKMGYTF